ncbi:AtpZ/AtpI family protein [Allomuricauda sp. AC10]|uniref:AtpZ/AtpI family protein n=1 Tax=Flavobacteriaceae TaxID=49546 RepID=UPI0014918EA0|nr:AtpZ/AtpI family protein [Muricauda sp. AC10]
MSQQKSPKKKRQLNSYVKFSGIVFQMISIILIGTFVGIKLDENYPNDQNWFTIGFSLYSVITSIIFVIRKITK